MSAIRFTPAAQVDVDAIWNYTIEKWGQPQAVKYIRGLRDKIEQLTEFQNLGRDCSYLSAGYRSLVSGQHLIFYKPAGEEIIVVRILHSRMDFGQLPKT